MRFLRRLVILSDWLISTFFCKLSWFIDNSFLTIILLSLGTAYFYIHTHHTTFLKLARAKSPPPFPIVIGRTTGFYFRQLTNLKFSDISFNFRGRKTPTTWVKVDNFFTEINHKFCKHNAEQNFQFRFLAQLWSCHVPKVMGKTEKADETESLQTAGGPTGY